MLSYKGHFLFVLKAELSVILVLRTKESAVAAAVLEITRRKLLVLTVPLFFPTLCVCVCVCD